MCLASACLIDGTLPNKLSQLKPISGDNKVTIEHISGNITSIININLATHEINSAAFTRTAKILLDGTAFIY